MGLKSIIRPLPASDMAIADPRDALEGTIRAFDVWLVRKHDPKGLLEAV